MSDPGRTETARWEAVAARDHTADGTFVFAVRTTGVYCRPGCPSRRPRRENVAFYENWRHAEAAGFRPCKRCTPRAPSADGERSAVVEAACRYLADAEATPKLEEVAAHVGLSPFHFHRLFTRALGVTPREYAAEYRAQRLRDELAESKDVTSAIYAAGYGSSSRVYEAAGDTLGMPPSVYRTGAAGQHIRYGVAESSLGWLLVAVTARGVCAIELGDSPAALRASLERRFARAHALRDDAAVHDSLTAVLRFIGDPRAAIDLPLDVAGTAFQRRVWLALREIPAGETATYAQLAQRIGEPRAVRAVASACGANPLAMAIPCHRAVRSDGGEGGYRWGAGRKRELLRKERTAAPR